MGASICSRTSYMLACLAGATVSVRYATTGVAVRLDAGANHIATAESASPIQHARRMPCPDCRRKQEPLQISLPGDRATARPDHQTERRTRVAYAIASSVERRAQRDRSLIACL